MNLPWAPSPLERKCLQHLDAPDSWKILRTEPHEKSEVLPWRVFRVVFLFNFVLFTAIFAVLFSALEIGAGAVRDDILQDLPYGVAAIILLAVGFALYSAHLYRRSWNRRARYLQRED